MMYLIPFMSLIARGAGGDRNSNRPVQHHLARAAAGVNNNYGLYFSGNW